MELPLTRVTVLATRDEFEINFGDCELVKDAKQRLDEIVGFPIEIVCAGRVLLDEERISQTEIVRQNARIVLVRKHRPSNVLMQQQREQVREEMQNERPEENVDNDNNDDNNNHHQNNQDDNDDEPICRICHSGVDATLGRLFSPCQCRGSVRFVHVDCLNTWRRMSANPRSYYECEQCHYRYNVARSELAEKMASFYAVESLTGLLLLIAVVTGGLVTRAAGLHEWFYNLILWTPWWQGHFLANTLDVICCGGLCLGAVGFALSLSSRPDWSNALLHMGILVLANGQLILRIFAVVGVAFCVRHVYQATRDYALRILHKWGEVVLEVR